jgi:acyl-coenzyme A thioesterase PaaI-like protein
LLTVTIIAIHNEDWGFETNCFVCEPNNSHGLRIPFFHDTDTDVVFAEFHLSGSFSGAPSFIHGGVTLAILDEAMAWACIAVGHRWAVTVETTTRFLGPVYVDKPYRVEARVGEVAAEQMRADGVVIDGKGRVRAEANAVFAVLGEAQAARAIGVDISDIANGGFTKP